MGLTVLISENTIRFSQLIGIGPNRTEGVATSIQNHSTDEIQFSTHVQDEDSKKIECHRTLNESASVWFEYQDHLIVWSCHEVREGKEIFYDAALIYGVFVYPMNEKMFTELIPNLRSIANYYFNESLEEFEKLTEPFVTAKWPISQKCPTIEIFKCKQESLWSNAILIPVVVLFIVLGISANLIKDYSHCRSNQIHPL